MSARSPLPGSKAKAGTALAGNIRWMVEQFGVERVGFLTLTFADGCSCRKESERRFNSIMNLIRQRYQCGVVVLERQQSGAIHYHLLCVLGGDIRTGLDFDAIARRDYRSAPPRLRAEWSYWRRMAPRYGFGRHEMLPIRTSGEQVGHYVFKYLKKDYAARKVGDKGFRTLRYFGRWSVDGRKCGPPWSMHHGTMSPKARAWRYAVQAVASRMAARGMVYTAERLRELRGPRWAFNLTLALRHWQLPVHADPHVQKQVELHNADVALLHGASERNKIENSFAKHWFPSDSWTDGDILRARQSNRRDCETYRLLQQSLHERMPCGVRASGDRLDDPFGHERKPTAATGR